MKITAAVLPLLLSVGSAYAHECQFGDVRVEVLSSGRDLVTIHMPGIASYHDPIADGKYLKCNADIKSNGDNIVTVRHGENRDLHRFYTRNAKGELDVFKLRLQDGKQHSADLRGNTYSFTYGKYKDLTRIYTFDGNKWSMTRDR